MTANSLHPGFIITDLMRHIDSHVSGLGEALAAVLFVGQKWLLTAAMNADTGALTQVHIKHIITLLSPIWLCFFVFVVLQMMNVD